MADKNYYIMLSDPPWAGPTATVEKGPEVMVNDGVFLNDVKKGYEITLSVDKKADNASDFPPCDIHGPSRSLIFSQRFIDILNSLGVDNVQYFDADVTYAPTGEKIPYKVANIVGVVSGLDLDESEVIMSSRGSVLAIDEMCLDEKKLEGNKICRLQEDVMLTVVHRSIKEAVEDAGLTGFLFVSDEEFEPGMI